jgi:hypothetical protein
LKPPPRMKWSITRFASFNCFHINTLLFGEHAA